MRLECQPNEDKRAIYQRQANHLTQIGSIDGSSREPTQLQMVVLQRETSGQFKKAIHTILNSKKYFFCFVCHTFISIFAAVSMV